MNYGMLQLSCSNFWITECGRIVTVVGTHSEEFLPVVADASTGRQFLVQKDHSLLGPLRAR